MEGQLRIETAKAQDELMISGMSPRKRPPICSHEYARALNRTALDLRSDMLLSGAGVHMRQLQGWCR